jgi:hypothetical protein
MFYCTEKEIILLFLILGFSSNKLARTLGKITG